MNFIQVAGVIGYIYDFYPAGGKNRSRVKAVIVQESVATQVVQSGYIH